MKAAVIGLGPHGRRIVNVLRDFPGVELAAVVDRNESALAAVDVPPSTARYTSEDLIWSHSDVPLVCIATNADSHEALAVTAMERGSRYLLVEKPMACSLAQCDRILDKARQTNARVVVGHGRRHTAVYQWLRERIAAGVWGKVRALWVQRPDIGLGCNATHSFDLAMHLTGATVERVTGWVDKPLKKNPRGEKFIDPGGLVVMELSDGARAIVTQIEDGAGPTSLEIHLTGARIYYDEGRGGLPVVVKRDLSVARSPTQGAKFCEELVPQNVVGKLDMLGMIRGCLEHLVSDAATNGEAQHGRAAVEVLVASYLSDRRGNQPVSLPLTRREELELTLPVT